MIHVLCLNPAIDKLYEVDGFAVGEDYPGLTPRVAAGGKGVNVARVLSQLGSSVRLYAFLGESGAEPVREDMERRCACTWISVPGACRTSINIVDRTSGRETVLTESGPRVSAQQVQGLMDELEAHVQSGEIVCCSGSIIAGAGEDIYAQISRLCERLGAFCALDCNARHLPASLRGARYMLGKPNERELAGLLHQERTQDPRRLAAMARGLMPPYAKLLISMGAQGGVLVGEDTAAYCARVPRTPVVSTVGSGDACLAGALHAFSQGADDPTALTMAMACGVLNAMEGRVGYVDAARVEDMMRRIQVERMSD